MVNPRDIAGERKKKKKKKKDVTLSRLLLEGNCHRKLVWLWLLQGSTDHRAE